MVEGLDHADRLRSRRVLELDRRASRFVVDVAIDRVARVRTLQRCGRARDAALGGCAELGDLARVEHGLALEESVVAPRSALGFGQPPARTAIAHRILIAVPRRRAAARVFRAAGFYASFTPYSLRSADGPPRVPPP